MNSCLLSRITELIQNGAPMIKWMFVLPGDLELIPIEKEG